MDPSTLIPRLRKHAGTAPQRFWEVDYCRGIAIFMMILFHAVFDLAYAGVYPINVNSGPWRLLAISTASLFLILVGVSLTLSAARASKVMDARSRIMKFLRRGAGIMMIGLFITLITLILVPREPIIFGILHLIGFSVMISPLFLRWTWGCLIAAMVIIPAGWIISSIHGPLWVAWLGITPPGFASLDYTPVFPWLGVVLVGVFLGHFFYPGGERRFRIPDSNIPGKVWVSLIGRHSLVIYILHQPVLIFLISLFFSTSVISPW